MPRPQRPVRTPGERSGQCASPRLISHPALNELTIAQIDCDVFCAMSKSATGRNLPPFRLIGIGADRLVEESEADRPTLFERELGRRRRLERPIDNIRDKLGPDALRREAGSTWSPDRPRTASGAPSGAAARSPRHAQ